MENSFVENREEQKTPPVTSKKTNETLHLDIHPSQLVVKKAIVDLQHHNITTSTNKSVHPLKWHHTFIILALTFSWRSKTWDAEHTPNAIGFSISHLSISKKIHQALLSLGLKRCDGLDKWPWNEYVSIFIDTRICRYIIYFYVKNYPLWDDPGIEDMELDWIIPQKVYMIESWR